MNRLAHFHFVFVLLALGFILPSHGQFGRKLFGGNKQDTVVEKLSKSTEQERLLKAQEEVDEERKGSLSTLAPQGVSEEEIAAYKKDLDSTITTIAQSLKRLESITEAEETAKEAQSNAAKWSGFEDKAPESLLFVDGLVDQQEAAEDVLASLRSILKNFDSLWESSMETARVVGEAEDKLTQALAHAGAEEKERKQWRLQAAQAASRLAALRVRAIQANQELYKQQIRAKEAELQLLRRQIEEAEKTATLRVEDVEKIQSAASEKIDELKKRGANYAERIGKTQIEHEKLRTKVDDLTKKLVEINSDAASKEEKTEAQKKEISDTENTLKLVKQQLAVTSEQIETLEQLQNTVEILQGAESDWVRAFQARRDCLLLPRGGKRWHSSLNVIREFRKRLQSWDQVTEDQLKAARAELVKRDSELAGVEGKEQQAIANLRRQLSAERLEGRQIVRDVLSPKLHNLNRWEASFAKSAAADSAWEKIKRGANGTWNGIRQGWNYEITSFDATTVRGGVVIPNRVPVTPGLIVKAILFFTIGYWLATVILGRLQHILVRRGRLEDTQARTLRNWLMIVISSILAIATMAILKIPFTVFALFGGALAIGLGFGTQNLIKNFISGVVLLVERKVRVGDVLLVDDTMGRVVEVNARSSVLRSANGVETLIPNSMFLEGKVSNLTLGGSRTRKVVEIYVDIESDVEQTMKAMTEIAKDHPQVEESPMPFATLEECSEFFRLQLHYWVNLRGPVHHTIVASDLRVEICKKFGELGIRLPRLRRVITSAYEIITDNESST